MKSIIFSIFSLLSLSSSLLYSETSNSEITNLYIVGDSLSCTGNFLNQSPTYCPPCFKNRFSDGPLWVDVLSKKLNLPEPRPSSKGGFNFAFGDATSQNGTHIKDLSAYNLPNVVINDAGQQVQELVHKVNFFEDPNHLVVIWVGGNDAGKALKGSLEVFSAPENIANHIETLAKAGAKNFLIPSFPPFQDFPTIRVGLAGMIKSYSSYLPEFVSNSFVSAAQGAVSLATSKLNSDLLFHIEALKSRYNLSITYVDTHTCFASLINNPDEFGVRHVFDPAWEHDFFPQFFPEISNEHAFFDLIHPNSKLHRCLGDKAYQALHNVSELSTKVVADGELTYALDSLFPDSDFETLDLMGDFLLDEKARLYIEVDRTQAESLNVAGNAELKGGLLVNLKNNLDLQFGTQYQILSASHILGRFEKLTANIHNKAVLALDKDPSATFYTLTVLCDENQCLDPDSQLADSFKPLNPLYTTFDKFTSSIPAYVRKSCILGRNSPYTFKITKKHVLAYNHPLRNHPDLIFMGNILPDSQFVLYKDKKEIARFYLPDQAEQTKTLGNLTISFVKSSSTSDFITYDIHISESGASICPPTSDDVCKVNPSRPLTHVYCHNSHLSLPGADIELILENPRDGGFNETNLTRFEYLGAISANPTFQILCNNQSLGRITLNATSTHEEIHLPNNVTLNLRAHQQPFSNSLFIDVKSKPSLMSESASN